MKFRVFKRKWRSGSLKARVNLMLALLLVIAYIPVLPGLTKLTSSAYAATNMRIEPSELSPGPGKSVEISFSFNAADDGQEQHETNINLCTPQKDGSAPLLGDLITSGVYPTKKDGQYIVHKYVWDGKIGGVPLDEGRYNICISPAEYNGSGVYYGQIASFEILGGDEVQPPAALQIRPAASGQSVVSGTAEPGTLLEVELYYPSSGEDKLYSNVAVNSAGQWSQQLGITPGVTAHITARAKKDGKFSGYSEPLAVLRAPMPAFSLSWEALAAYYYKLDSVQAMKEKAQDIAVLNQSAASSGTISGLTSILLTDPQTARAISSGDLTQFTEAAIQDRLRIVNPSGQARVDPARGDFVYSSDSISLQALMPLQFGLSYLSRDPYKGVNGLGWHHSYEWKLNPLNGGKVEVMSPDGSLFEYVPLAGGQYLTPRGTDWTLNAPSSGEYTLASPQGDLYRFNAEGLLQSVTDLNGNQIAFAYQGKKLEEVSTAGASLSLSYDGAGKLIAVSDLTGRQMSFHYDPASGDMTSITDVDGATTKLTYDDNHHVLSVTDAKGTAVMSVAYDDHQRVTSFTDFYGNTSSSAYEGRVAPVVRGEEPEGGETGIDPANGRDIPESNEVILSGTMNNLAHAPAYRKVEGLKPLIADYLAGSIGTIESKQNVFSASAVAAPGGIADIQSAIAASSASPAVVSSGHLNVEESVTFGSPGKPVVLIVDGMNTNKDITVRVYGTLILKQGLNANTKLALDVQKVQGLYGNLWSGGTIHLNNDSSVTVGDTLQTGSLTYNSGGLTVDAQRILIAGDLSINTRVEMNIAQEMTVGGIVSNNQTANLTVTGGDLFVRDNVSVNNNLKVQTGGLFVLGGDMTPNQTPVVRTGVGSGKTILTYPQSGAGSAGSGSTNNASFGKASSTSSGNARNASSGISAAVSPAGLATSITTTANKTTWTNALHQDTSYIWNNNFQVAQRHAANGAVVKYSYDSSDRVTAITDANGNKGKFAYDERGNLTQTTDESGYSSLTRYNAMNRPVEEIDALGNRATYEYDTAGNLVKSTDALGGVVTIARDSAGVPVSVTDAEGHTTAYTNDADGFAKEIKDPSGYTTIIERDTLHRTTKITDAEGKLQAVDYDQKDRAVAVTNALDQTSSVTYDANGNPVEHTDAAGSKTVSNYQVYRLSSTADALQNSTSKTYDAIGRVIEAKDEAGAVTAYSYDSVGQLEEVTDAEGHSSTYTYDDNGNMLTQKDAKGNITSYTYSKRNELLSVTDPLGAKTRYRYDAAGNTIKETDALGNSTYYDYNALGQLVKVTDALGAVTEYQYDKNGNQVAVIDPNHSIWTTKYDSRGLDAGTINPLKEETAVTRNARGLMTEFLDAAGQKTTYEYDALGRNTRVRNALGYETTYAYDAQGNVEKIVDANHHETAFTYDPLGRLTEVKNAEGSTTKYSYDASGNLLDKTNALGAVTSYRYDALNRVIESVNPLQEITSLAYDENGNLQKVTEPDSNTTVYAYNKGNQVEQIQYGNDLTVKYKYDLAGRRSLMTDSTGDTRYTYDALNRPTSVIDPRGNNVRYEWTATGQRSRIIYPDNTVVSYDYDKLDRIKQVTDAQNGITSYLYDAAGRLKEKLLPNKGQSTYSYDGAGQLLEMKHTAPGGALLEQLTYVYDPAGNKIRSERQEGGSDEDNPAGTPRPADIADYAYDALNQLVQVQKQNGSRVIYSYDTVGNRLGKETTEAGTSIKEQYTYDAANKLTHFEKGSDYKDYTYDKRGNLLEVSGIDSEAALGLFTAKTSAQKTTVPDSVYSDTGTNGLEAGEDAKVKADPSASAGGGTSAAAATNSDANDATTTAATDPLVELLDPLSSIPDPASSPAGTIPTDVEGASLSGLPDADVKAGVTGDVYSDKALTPEALLKAALAAGPQVLESNRWDASNRLIKNTNTYGDITTYQYDGDGNRVSMRTTIGDGALQDTYLPDNPAGNRDGWEPQYKKRQLELYFTNDITMSIPQPLMATGAAGQNWKQSYVYGAGEERISMSYLVSGDKSNDWEPAAGASGASAAAGAPKTLFYLSDAQGSVIGLEGQDGSMSARYRYDEFGVAEAPEKFDLNWSGPDNLFGYTSLGYDYYSGYSHAQARDFDSSIGRFISEDTYEGDINNPQTLNLYTYVHNNPLFYTDPTGHEALPKTVQELYNELKVITGGAKNGAKKSSKAGLASVVIGVIVGGLFAATPAGESQQRINQDKAKRVDLPIISAESLKEKEKSKNGTYVFRALNDTDIEMLAAGQGIIAKDPLGTWSAAEHIKWGSDVDAWTNDPWISTTIDPMVAFEKFDGNRNGVVIIDLSKISGNKIYFPTAFLPPGSEEYMLSFYDKEVLIKYSIPQEAIVGVMFSN
ncbi:RHS repeat-associated core domain-containing protein [Paenibacillus riograndensis]|uniref:RHS repeat-associated core domain-containing protein n=1 Tax=Paenibacillus riograndensis TaxID=483937 RepID=UPI000B227EA6|nr:RHS repeat-associated core domain-containing protein [Paenibacillus riograndensis]